MKVKELVLYSLLSAILFVVQVSLAFLPNIELVSLFIILFTLLFKKKVFYIIYLFASLEGLVYGFGIWWITYLYIWSVLAIITMLFHKNTSLILWAVLSGFFGLSFGLLCSFPYWLIQGIGGFWAYFIQGIPFDVIHCIGNFIVTLLLFRPLYYILSQLKKTLYL